MLGVVSDAWHEEAAMPKLLRAPPKDLGEERQVRKLAGSRHAPGDWIQRARMIARSWDGARTTQIAAELGCHPQTVRERIWRLPPRAWAGWGPARRRAEEHTSELQSRRDLVCRLLLEKKKKKENPSVLLKKKKKSNQ